MPSLKVATVLPPTVIRSTGEPFTSSTLGPTLIFTVVPGVPSAPAGPVKPIEPSLPLITTDEPSLPLIPILPSTPSVPSEPSFAPIERLLLKPTVILPLAASAVVVIF